MRDLKLTYSYNEASWCTLLLIAHNGHAFWPSKLQCGWVGMASMVSTCKLLVCGDPVVGHVIATTVIEVRALWCVLYSDCFLHDLFHGLARLL